MTVLSPRASRDDFFTLEHREIGTVKTCYRSKTDFAARVIATGFQTFTVAVNVDGALK